MTDDQLRAAARAANLRQLLEAVGLQGRGANYTLYRARLLRLGITDSRLHRREQPVEPTAAELAAAAAASRSIAEVCRSLGLSAEGRPHRRVAALLVQHGIDTRHFTGQAWNLGRRDLPSRGRPLSELLRVGSRIRSSALKQRLLREGVLAPVCSRCGGGTWLDGPMPLELDHRNGDGGDNRLANLRLLCPNCHALTATYRGRNIGRRS